MPKSNINN